MIVCSEEQDDTRLECLFDEYLLLPSPAIAGLSFAVAGPCSLPPARPDGTRTFLAASAQPLDAQTLRCSSCCTQRPALCTLPLLAHPLFAATRPFPHISIHSHSPSCPPHAVPLFLLLSYLNFHPNHLSAAWLIAVSINLCRLSQRIPTNPL